MSGHHGGPVSGTISDLLADLEAWDASSMFSKFTSFMFEEIKLAQKWSLLLTNLWIILWKWQLGASKSCERRLKIRVVKILVRPFLSLWLNLLALKYSSAVWKIWFPISVGVTSPFVRPWFICYFWEIFDLFKIYLQIWVYFRKFPSFIPFFSRSWFTSRNRSITSMLFGLFKHRMNLFRGILRI